MPAACTSALSGCRYWTSNLCALSSNAAAFLCDSLFVGPAVCLRLPSDPASRHRFPLSGRPARRRPLPIPCRARCRGMLAVARIAAQSSAVMPRSWPRPRPAAWRDERGTVSDTVAECRPFTDNCAPWAARCWRVDCLAPGEMRGNMKERQTGQPADALVSPCQSGVHNDWMDLQGGTRGCPF